MELLDSGDRFVDVGFVEMHRYDGDLRETAVAVVAEGGEVRAVGVCDCRGEECGVWVR